LAEGKTFLKIVEIDKQHQDKNKAVKMNWKNTCRCRLMNYILIGRLSAIPDVRIWSDWRRPKKIVVII